MTRYRSQALFLIIASLVLVATFLPLLASERVLDAFAREDGVFENLTALYLFLTSLIFAVAFFRFRNSPWLLRLSYAGLALIFFLGAGEEISWGERIFGWNEQNFIRERNVQGELTLHNLEYFQGEDSILPVSISQLFILFTFVVAVLIPAAGAIWPAFRNFVAPRFPVLPLYPGLLVLLTYAMQKLMLRILQVVPGLYKHPSMPIPQGVHEIREHGYTLALLLSALIYLAYRWKARGTQEEPLSRSSAADPGISHSGTLEQEGEKI